MYEIQRSALRVLDGSTDTEEAIDIEYLAVLLFLFFSFIKNY